jgi:hypothetical protein
MKSICIDFASLDGPKLDLTKITSGFAATVQCALVNVGTDRGSDPVFPERGTDLKIDGARGKMATRTWSTQTANFAALRTLTFVQQNDVPANRWPLQKFVLRVDKQLHTSVDLSVEATAKDGTTVGGLATV